MNTACPLLTAIQEGGNLLLQVRAKRMLHSEEQRPEGRALASRTSYLVNNLKTNPHPGQGSEKTQGARSKVTPDSRPPLHLVSPEVPASSQSPEGNPKLLQEANPRQESLLLPILLGLLAIRRSQTIYFSLKATCTEKSILIQINSTYNL